MADITLGDLLDLRTAITDDMRHEVGRMETGLHLGLGEVKSTQAQHGLRLDRQGREISELRTTLEERTTSSGILDLTPKQKKLLWGGAVALSGACVESLWRVGGWIVAWVGTVTR
jgi:hypothetical protein